MYNPCVSVVAAVAVAHRELLLSHKRGWMRIAHSQSPAQHKELLYHLKGDQNLCPAKGVAQRVVVVLLRMPIVHSQETPVSLVVIHLHYVGFIIC